MAIPAFDTYVAAKTLRTAGFDEKQTEAAVTVIRNAVAESSAASATKEGQDRLQADLDRLQADLDKLRAEMKEGHAELRAELRAEMKAGLDRLQAGQDKLQADHDKLRADMLHIALAFAALMLTGFGTVVALLV